MNQQLLKNRIEKKLQFGRKQNTNSGFVFTKFCLSYAKTLIKRHKVDMKNRILRLNIVINYLK